MDTKCCVKVSDARGWNHWDCNKHPFTERDGKTYCKIHDPEYIKQKDAEREAKRNENNCKTDGCHSRMENSSVENQILTSIWNKFGANLIPRKVGSLLIRIGCEVHTIEEWDEHGAAYGEKTVRLNGGKAMENICTSS